MAEGERNQEELDQEWVFLMKTARHIGMKKEDIRNFLKEQLVLANEQRK